MTSAKQIKNQLLARQKLAVNRWIAGVCCFVGLIAMLVMLGWVLDIAQLKSVFPGLATMKFNTALCFFILSCALFVGRSPVSFTLKTVVLMIAGVSILEYWFGINMAIDELFIADPESVDADQVPGRMSPGTSCSFLLLSVALMLGRWEGRAVRYSVQLCVLLVLLVAGTALLGYLYGIQVFQPLFFSTMALHTAVLFILLAVAILASHPGYDLPVLLTSRMNGGRLARKMLPIIIVFPTLLGWVILQGLEAGRYSIEFSYGLNAIMTIFVLALLVFVGSTSLIESEQHLYQMIESAPAAMVMIDQDGTVVMVNALTETLFGYERSEMLGKPVENLIPERFRQQHPGLRSSFFQQPSARLMGEGRDLYGLRRDGSEFAVEIGLGPLKTYRGTFVLAAIADITWRKQAMDEIHMQSEELSRSNKDLEQFAYIASHDLQEPLRAVSGCVQLLQRRYEGQLDERADEFIRHAVDGTVRMQNLIDDLLTYSRVGRQQERRAISANEALRHALENLQVSLRETSTELDVEDFDDQLMVPYEYVMLFQNLLANGIKFRKPGEPPRLSVSCDEDQNVWRFKVSDNGIGIEPKHFNRIFEIFQRLHPISRYQGTGIGLALCKRIVELYGGSISVDSEPGQGAMFSFTLPRGWYRERAGAGRQEKGEGV